MKKIIAFLFCLFTIGSFAQDTIFKRSAEIILAKILEITPSEVKYKKFEFQDGPTYIEIKSKIQKIHFSNGMKETFEAVPETKTAISISKSNEYYPEKPVESNKIDVWSANRFTQNNRTIRENDLHIILLKTKDKKIINLVGAAKDAKKMQYIGFAAIPIGIASYGLMWASLLNSTPSSGAFGIKMEPRYLAGSAVCLIAAVACPIASGSFKKKRNVCNRAAVKLYNEKY
ncbi:MAG: hypothetical protein IPP64_09525 [Bacteroidetes bacterium]|nr:hypothetical protein [Bacteroidota bacterium]